MKHIAVVAGNKNEFAYYVREKLSGTDLDFQVRPGEMILGDERHFYVTGRDQLRGLNLSHIITYGTAINRPDYADIFEVAKTRLHYPDDTNPRP